MAEDPKLDEVVAMFKKAEAFTQELLRENERLRAQLGEVEREKHEFADRYTVIEQHNDLLQNLFVSSYRLHATLDPPQVVATIEEILANLVGAEVFGIWMLDEDRNGELRLLSQLGLGKNSDLDPTEIALVREVLPGEPWYRNPADSLAQPAKSTTPLAVVPIKVEGRPVGVIVIRQLLHHKKSLGEMDRQVLALLSGQAAIALASSRLYTEKVRKLDTMTAFLDFIKKKS